MRSLWRTHIFSRCPEDDNPRSSGARGAGSRLTCSSSCWTSTAGASTAAAGRTAWTPRTRGTLWSTACRGATRTFDATRIKTSPPSVISIHPTSYPRTLPAPVFLYESESAKPKPADFSDLWYGLPTELVHLALAFDGSMKPRAGRYMTQLRRDDPRYAMLSNIARGTHRDPVAMLAGIQRDTRDIFFNSCSIRLSNPDHFLFVDFTRPRVHFVNIGRIRGMSGGTAYST